MKALDFVKTPKGFIALIKETNNNGEQASIDFVGGGNPSGEKSAWWSKEELEVIDSLPHMLARSTCHPFGSGEKDADKFHGVRQESKQSGGSKHINP
jgi:hypothetical protein